MNTDEVEARALADHAAMIGKLIRATSVVCSDGDSYVDDFTFPEPITLRVHADAGDIKRWMDADHMDPWYYVDLVDAPAASRKILDDGHAHVVAVYGPSYHLDGKYEKPDWKVVNR